MDVCNCQLAADAEDPCGSTAGNLRKYSGADDLRVAALGLMSAGLAHDLGNHLQVVASAVRMMDREAHHDDAALQRSIMGSALTAIERASLLARRIFALSTSADTAEITALNSVIRSLTDAIALVAGPSIVVESRLSLQEPMIFCDTRELENVILNLAINARDAMPGGGRLTISTDLDASQSEECRALVRVEDTGRGMTNEVLLRAFEPFFTTKESHGTGLGLATVSDFVRRAGGSAQIQTVPGRGTSVILSLPTCG